MRRMSACRQLLTGTSISRYLPPMGTAGLERVAVSGNRRDPWPPPRMIASVSPDMNIASKQTARLPVRARQSNHERGARARSVAHGLDAPVVQLDQPPRQRQPDAEAVARLPARVVTLHERFEDVRQHRGRDADARIAHADHHVAVVLGGT